MRIFKTFLIFVILSTFITCSNSDNTVSGGATDNPNTISGAASYFGCPAVNKEVMLKSIKITEKGDTVISWKSTITDTAGGYRFYDVIPGKYLIYSEDISSSGILTGIEKGKERLKVEKILDIKNKIVIKGRVLEGNELIVSVPGTETISSPDNAGFYVLSGVPSGEYSIAFISETAVNYLPVKIEPTRDTVFIRDVRFTASAEQANTVYKPYETTIETNLSVVTEDYADTSEPEWYSGKDFSGIEYKEEVTVFLFDNSTGNNLWSDPENWDPDGIPGDSDTADVFSDICIMPDKDSVFSCIRLFEHGDLRIVRNIDEVVIMVDNSTVSMYKEEPKHVNGEIVMLGDTLWFDIEPIMESELFLDRSFTGSGKIIKYGRGGVVFEGDTTDFNGDWHVVQGEVRTKMPYAVGKGNIYVEPEGVLDIEDIKSLWHTDTLSLAYDESSSLYGVLIMDATTRVNYLKINDVLIPSGVYDSLDYPDYLWGDDSLYVENP